MLAVTLPVDLIFVVALTHVRRKVDAKILNDRSYSAARLGFAWVVGPSNDGRNPDPCRNSVIAFLLPPRGIGIIHRLNKNQPWWCEEWVSWSGINDEY